MAIPDYIGISNFRTSANLARREKLLDKYKKYQVDDGIPIYLKGGFMDRILFQATAALCIFGFIDGGMTLYSMAKPKKKK